MPLTLLFRLIIPIAIFTLLPCVFVAKDHVDGLFHFLSEKQRTTLYETDDWFEKVWSLQLPIVVCSAVRVMHHLNTHDSCCAQEMCFLARLLGVYCNVAQHRAHAAIYGPKMEQGKWGSGHHKRLPQIIIGLAPWHKKVAPMTTLSGGMHSRCCLLAHSGLFCVLVLLNVSMSLTYTLYLLACPTTDFGPVWKTLPNPFALIVRICGVEGCPYKNNGGYCVHYHAKVGL